MTPSRTTDGSGRRTRQVAPAKRPAAPAKRDVTCIVPARNEADRITETVKHLYDLPCVGRVVVVDDGSSDGTAGTALAAGAIVLTHPRRMGKGGALDAAVDRFAEAGVYLLIDGDVGATAAEAGRLVEAVRTGGADLAIGRLPSPATGGFGLVKRMAAGLIRGASGFDATEPLSGQRAVRGDVLRACRPFAPRFGIETAMTIDAVRLGYRVAEVDVPMGHRPTGRDLRGFAHRGLQGVDILAAGVRRLAGLR
jgi:glycosyltransferase involved in cell wall biosynthesis